MNCSDVADALFKLFHLRNKTREHPVGFVSSDDHSYEELFPEGGEQAPSTASRVKFADVDGNRPLETGITLKLGATASWSNQWGQYFNKPQVKSILKPSKKWKLPTYPVIASLEDDTDPIFRPNLLEHNDVLLSSAAEANEYLENTYPLTLSEAAEEAATRVREEVDNEEDDPIPAAKDRGYLHASLRIGRLVGRCRFSHITKQSNIGFSEVEFDLVTEAALFADCILHIRWHRDGDDPTYNFDTINKFIRHHEAEVKERELTKSLAESIADVRAQVMERAKVARNSRLTKAEIKTRRTAVLTSLVVVDDDDDAVDDIVLCWEEQDDEGMNAAEAAGEDDGSDSSEDDESDDGDVCTGNPVFNMIYNNTEIRPEYLTWGLKSKVAIGNRGKGMAKDIAKAFNASQGIDGSDASRFQNESRYVSAVHDHEHHDGYSAFEGKREDIERTKKEIDRRKRVAYQMRGLHLALTHKKVWLCFVIFALLRCIT